MRIFVLICLVALPLTLASPGPVWAKEYNIKQMTAEVSVALESRRERYDRLTDLKKKGVIGENNKGYVSVLKHDPQVAELVKAENKDRKVIYQTIADQNGLIDAIGVVEEVFAGVQRDKASQGDMVQQANGSWVTK